MTITNENNRNSQAGNDVLTTFNYTFRILAEEEILVTLVVDSTGAETTQVLSTNYTVTGVDADAGGTIEMITPPATGETLVMTRDVAVIQNTDLVSNGPLPSESLEKTLDRQIMILQQQTEILDRAITIPIGSSATTDFPLPEADAPIGWDDTGTFLINLPTSATSESAAAADASAAAASAAAALVSENASAASAASITEGNLIMALQVFT